VQNPLRLSADSEPQPDLLLRRASIRRAGGPKTVLALIQVADSSLAYDRAERLTSGSRVTLELLPDATIDVAVDDIFRTA
jgi:hypothetical protein